MLRRPWNYVRQRDFPPAAAETIGRTKLPRQAPYVHTELRHSVTHHSVTGTPTGYTVIKWSIFYMDHILHLDLVCIEGVIFWHPIHLLRPACSRSERAALLVLRTLLRSPYFPLLLLNIKKNTELITIKLLTVMDDTYM